MSLSLEELDRSQDPALQENLIKMASLSAYGGEQSILLYLSMIQIHVFIQGAPI